MNFSAHLCNLIKKNKKTVLCANQGNLCKEKYIQMHKYSFPEVSNSLDVRYGRKRKNTLY